MTSWLLCAHVALMLSAFTQAAAAAVGTDIATVGADEVVWHWYAQCTDARPVKVEVTLNGKLEYQTSFEVCHMPRSSIVPDSPQRILQFNLRSKARSLFGERKGENLEGSIWEAGEDQSDLVLGVSFADNKRVWCNTLHIVNPEVPTKSNLAHGLVIKTLPAGRSGH